MPDDSRKLLWKADELPAQEHAVTQRLNPNSHLLRTGLSRLAGLQRAHVSLGRVPPGKDSFAYHSQMVEERNGSTSCPGAASPISMPSSMRSGRVISWAFRRPGPRICCATRLARISSI